MDRDYEHFGFSAQRVSIERKHFLQKILHKVFGDMVEKVDCLPETSEQLAKEKDNVIKTMLLSLEGHVKAADELDTKLFTVPNHVLLPSQFDQAKSYTESDEKQIDEQIKLHKKTFLENTIMLNSLNIENQRYKHFASFLNDELFVQNQLKESFQVVNMKELNDLVDAAISLNK